MKYFTYKIDCNTFFNDTAYFIYNLKEYHFFDIFGNNSDNINENIIITPPINRFSVNASCNIIIPINAAITLSSESSIPLVVADKCFIP